MSADNAIGIAKVGNKWAVKEIFMSADGDTLDRAEYFETEESALMRAIKLSREIDTEYGIVEFTANLISDVNQSSINVGEYSLTVNRCPGSIWIERKCGEGMEVKLERFEELIDKFYQENF